MNRPDSLGAALTESCERHKDKVALMHKVDGSYRSITYAEFSESAFALAAELMELGIQKGNCLSVLSANRPEWAIVDFACQLIGAVLVPIYPSLSAAQAQYILKDSGAMMLFAENEQQAQKAADLRGENISSRIFVFDAGKGNNTSFESFSAFLAEAKRHDGDNRAKVMEQLKSIKRDDLATLIYTSGTTGLPKGVMLTQENLLSNIKGAAAIFEVTTEDRILSLLPLSHVFERTVGHFLILINGATVAYAESPLTVAANLLEVHPTLMLAVPRFYEKMKARILDSVKKGSPLKRTIFKWAINTGKKTAKKGAAAKHNFRHRMADKLVFTKLKERTGGKLKFFISGGAALPTTVGEFFQAAGITILEGYGLTESSPILTVNKLDDVCFGTVGYPLPDVEIKIADDGEILARGPNIMQGYFNLPGDTKSTLNEDGFLNTGDIGRLDEAGRLLITGRKKEIMITSNGRNIAPTPIENTMKSSPYIAEIMLIGDAKPYLTALIVPELELLKAEGIGQKDDQFIPEEAVKDPQLIRLMEYEISRLSAGLSGYEHIIKFTLLPREFSIEEGELTPTMKVRRTEVIMKYADVINSMYSDSVENTI